MRHITDRIMMIRPASFQFNEETASSNAFQTVGNYDNEVIKASKVKPIRILRIESPWHQ